MENQILNDKAIYFENKKRKLNLEYFDIFRVIDKGQFADVFLVQSKKKKNLYALKKIQKKVIIDNGISDSVRKEIEFQMKFKNKNIIELYTYFEDEDSLYLIEEFAENGNLEQYLKKQKLKVRQKADAIESICKALKYMHEQNPPILHKNIRLNNILLDIELKAKLIDLGHFETLNSSIRSKIDIPDYIAPELLKGQEYTLKADIWCVGVILYFLISEKFPFSPSQKEDMSEQDIFLQTKKNILEKSPRNLKKFSPPLRDLLKKMLNKDPDQRITIKQILNDRWLHKHTSKPSIINSLWTTIRSKSKKTSIQKLERSSFQYNSQTSLNHTNGILNNSSSLSQLEMLSGGGNKVRKFNTNLNSQIQQIQPIQENLNETGGLFDSQIDENKILHSIMDLKAKQAKNREFFQLNFQFIIILLFSNYKILEIQISQLSLHTYINFSKLFQFISSKEFQGYQLFKFIISI